MLDPLPTSTVRVHRLDPTIAELYITFADLPDDVAVRGRLMGPRCPGVSTVEIAYPLQEMKHPLYRVLIPEPMRWSETQPYVYAGPVEFHQAGQVVGRMNISFGIKA